MLHAGRYVELESTLCELLERHPDSGAAWQMLGVALARQGKNSVHASAMAAKLLPTDAGAHNNLGNALARLGQWDQAVASYGRALSFKPDFSDAHSNLGNAFSELGQFEAAAASYRRALEINPQLFEAHNHLGNALRLLYRPAEAAASYRRALEIQPDFAEAHSNLGNVLVDLGQLNEALASYRRALTLKPNFAEAHNNMGSLLRGFGQLAEAIASYRRALVLKPDFAEAHSNLGIALRLLGRTVEAEASCRRALEINPKLTAAVAALAETHADRGLFAEAEEIFKRIISIEPESPEGWAGISSLRKMSVDDAAWLTVAQKIASQQLSPRREAYLRYAIGKYFDDVQDFDQAFSSFRRANELAKQYGATHDRRAVEQAVDQITRLYDRSWLSEAGTFTMKPERPVFIIGMLRSGTTLAEQILASHPAVYGAGELPYWTNAFAAYKPSADGSGTSAALLRRLAADYLRLLQDLSADARHVLDKMPANFWALGLIHAALPGARIIHMRRNPIDTCLSIYFQRFETGVSYANDLEDLAHYYTQYLRLVTHWRTILRADSILDVTYEDLVENQDAWTRKMLAFIGLPYDARCVDFHLTNRTVITASKWQVRQKISASSVDRWRNYEKFISPLLKLRELDPGG
ncbi:MAG TPA: tetratricopeptide repeat protein [Steroidobacteraceae bacterium]|jgi:tetratricopeptide (TPR) repeat protein|nr:tetratricopeptide repeat protein [Steroidobacteraceae bacterium]